MMRTLNFNFKTEDLVPLSEFAFTSYTRDHDKFIAFSPTYGGTHQANYLQQKQLVSDHVFPKALTLQLTTTTARLYLSLEEVKNHLEFLERYLDKSSSATGVSTKTFKLSAIKVKCKNCNAEGVIKDVTVLQQLIAPHLTELEKVGYNTELQAQLANLKTAIGVDNELQNSLLNQRIQLVSDNSDLLNSFWDIVNDVLKTGKTLFKKDPVKKKEYTQSELLKKMNHTSSTKDSSSDSDSSAKAS